MGGTGKNRKKSKYSCWGCDMLEEPKEVERRVVLNPTGGRKADPQPKGVFVRRKKWALKPRSIGSSMQGKVGGRSI